MKIAFILRRYGKKGGISRYVSEIAENLPPGNEIHVYCANVPEGSSGDIVFHRVPMLSMPVLDRRKKHAWNTLLEVVTFTLMATLMVKKKGYDIIHSQGDYAGPMDVYTAHSVHRAWLDIAVSKETGLKGRLKKSAINPLHLTILTIERISMIRAKSIIAISNRVRGEIVRWYGVAPERITVIPHGVNVDEFGSVRADRQAEKIREGLDAGDDDILILFPAQEFKRKGLGQLLEAVAGTGRSDIVLAVAGRDNPADYMDTIRENSMRVRFVGEQSDMAACYAASDIMVFPTLYEPFGLVILEAMASGLPVVTTDLAGAAEIIENGTEGILLGDRNDTGRLTSVLIQLADDAGLRERMGEAASAKAQYFTWEKIAQETYKVYSGLRKGEAA